MLLDSFETWDDATVQWNKSLEQVSWEPSSTLRLSFQDGSSCHADFLVAADGIYSMVRRLMFGPPIEASMASGTKPLRFLELFVVLGITHNSCIPSYQKNKLRQRQWLDGSTRVFTMPFDKENTMWQMSFPVTKEGIEETNSALSKEETIGIYS